MTQIDTSTETIKALLKDVTEGPWEVDVLTADGPNGDEWDTDIEVSSGTGRHIYGYDLGYCDDVDAEIKANARFIAASRELVPALLAERDALKAENERLKAQDHAVVINGDTFPIPYEVWELVDNLKSQSVTVKPLEWWISDTGDHCCDTMVGRYQIQKGATKYCMMPAMATRSRTSELAARSYHRKEEAAKAAAQADYERRILSAINIRSASASAAEARAGAIEAAEAKAKDAVAWKFFTYHDLDRIANSIHALHDTDTLAAIERIKEQARQEERERCATIAQDFGCCHVPAEIAKAIREDEW